MSAAASDDEMNMIVSMVAKRSYGYEYLEIPSASSPLSQISATLPSWAL